ncbi:MAG: BMP family ABC transporter substrate-binding protein [Acidimicrobiia bacterium]|nr:BMP family ABC transporter substrate-binding protein [Acidimicrobiia bacterium]
MEPVRYEFPSHPRHGLRWGAAVLAAVLAAGACATDSSTDTAVTSAATTTVTAATTTTSEAVTTTVTTVPEDVITACQISDFGDVDDAAVNEATWAGMEQAADEFGVGIDFLSSNDTANYPRHLATFIEQGCDLIVTTGALLANDTASAARANPDQLFAIVDYPVGAFDPWGDPPVENVRGLTFQVDEAAFLAGYLAAGMSTTHVIGTFGGLNIPPVTIFMEGFRKGALHYDGIHGTVTTVEGWNGTDGLFTADFSSQDKAYEFTRDLLDEGADIILPVADRAGEGACRAAVEAGGVAVIGTHWDWYFSAPDCGPVLLTSILKRFDVAVYKTIQNLVVINALGSQYLGTLKNDGVGLAPFHEFADAVPAELAAEVEALREDIISGAVRLNPGA